MKIVLYFLIILSVLSPVFSQSEPTGLKRFAIFAGSNDGGSERVRLEYAETDALSMYEVLSEIGGLSDQNTIIINDPDSNVLLNAFAEMKTIIEREKINSRRTEFFFYYSGHSDEMGILPDGELFKYSELRKEIDSMSTDVKVAVLDSCSSGSFTRLKGGVKKAPFLVDESVDTKGHAFLTSSSENEAAQESDAIEGSFFTHYLISALRGAADSTLDGTVTLNEAYSFAADETLARTTSSIAGAQHPSYSINLTGSGDLVLTDLREVFSSITLEKDIDGRIFFRDDSDRLVIEFRKRSGIPVSLSLPRGVYKVDLETEAGLTRSVVTVERGVINLNGDSFRSVERSFARSRGDNPLVDGVLSDEPTEKTIGESIDNTLDAVEESLEEKMEEIRTLINEKFSKDSIEEKEDVPDNEDLVFEERSDLEYSVFGFSPTPSYASSNDVRNISLNLIGKPYSINGFALGFMNMTYNDVYGAQIAVLSNQTGRDQYGFLASSIYNIVDRDLRGMSAAGIFSITEGSLYGVQTSGIFNISYHNMDGMQAGGIFNIVENQGTGLQAAGIFNIVDGEMNGLQAAGIFNIADGLLNGVQAAGIVNTAENINGAQIGLINIGKQVNGVQIGLININENINGLPVGLITISKNGITDFGGWYENSGFFYTGMQTGSKNFYNIAYLAFPVENQGTYLVSGLGIGGRINLGSFYFDTDISIKNVATGADLGAAIQQTFSTDQRSSLFPNMRISAGLKFFKIMSVFGGVSVDIHIPGHTNKNSLFHNSSNPWVISNIQNGKDILEFHPHWFLGLKI